MKELVSEARIGAAVETLAAEIRVREAGRPLTVIGVMTGSIVFVADLIRKLDMPLRVGIVQASSYRGGTRPENLIINSELLPDIAERDVLLVDDIFDTGRTLHELVRHLADFRPQSVRTAVLMLKQGRQEVTLRPDYVAFEIPDEFVVGYGLDYRDLYRNLPYIAALEPHEIRDGLSMRLALVTRRFWPLVGGAEMAMANLATEFQRLGHSVRVLTARWEPNWPLEIVHREVPVVRLPQPAVRGWGTIRYMWSLSHWLREHRSELDGVLVSMLKHDAFCAVNELHEAGVPVLLRAEGGGVTGDCQWQQTARFGARIARRCQDAAAIAAVTNSIQEELIAAGYSSEKIVRIDNGVRIPPLRAPGRRMAARAALAEANYDLVADEKTPVVVYTGRLIESKGLFDLIRAWAPIVENRPNARLWLVGEGPDRERLFDLIGDLGLKYRICLPGAFDDIEEVLQAADMFVLPSYAEGLSLSLLEAMAAGLPVIATDIPGNRDLVREGETGRLVPPREPKTLRKTLEELLDHPEQGVRLGVAARKQVQANYSLEKMAREHLAVFERWHERAKAI